MIKTYYYFLYFNFKYANNLKINKLDYISLPMIIKFPLLNKNSTYYFHSNIKQKINNNNNNNNS
jgi:hypothetical protein